MSLSTSNVSSLKNSIDGQLDPQSSAISSVENGLSGIQNPIGDKLNKVLFKINSVTSNAESKIDRLVDHITVSSDNRAKIELINNTIVITVKPKDKDILAVQQQKIQNDIDSITKTLNLLNNSISTLNTINNTAKVIKTAMDVQEALLSVNPASKAMFSVFKKAIKIVFLKDMMTQYINVITNQLSSNKEVLNRLISKFQHLRVQVKIDDENNAGNVVKEDQAASLITQGLIGGSDGTNETSISEFTSGKGKTYILKIEKYGDRKLIGKAYDKFSGMLVEQTAPSIIATADDLFRELKEILNIES